MASYSSIQETLRIFDYLSTQFDPVSLPPEITRRRSFIDIVAVRDSPYFPIPFKETETTAALKAIEGSIAAILFATASSSSTTSSLSAKNDERRVTVSLEKTTAFLFQAYLARVGGFGKQDKQSRQFLKDTDLLAAQSDPYRRMSANLYATARPGEYYHIHGSLEASTTLRMLGLAPFRPDLGTHEEIVTTIEAAVSRFTVDELERMNAEHRQAGVPALTHADFLNTPHGKSNQALPPWSVEQLEAVTPTIPLTCSGGRVLAGIKVLELCRIIAGPTITRILAEYGAQVIKVTSKGLSDVPFFQVDCNMGKHAVDIDLKTDAGRETFEGLLADVDVVVDGYRPGAIDKLGFGAGKLAELAEKRGKGIIYVNENCFGYEGEWAGRPGWQQIADCVTGVAWEQGKFMGLDEPVVPPFPISDYGTGCIGAITALIGLYHRATRGGSWHGKASLLHYDLLLFKVGMLPAEVQDSLRESVNDEMRALRHAHSVDQVSGATLRRMRELFPDFVDDERYLDRWQSHAYGASVDAVLPVVEIDGVEISFQRASRPNGSDEATWEFGEERDYRR